MLLALLYEYIKSQSLRRYGPIHDYNHNDGTKGIFRKGMVITIKTNNDDDDDNDSNIDDEDDINDDDNNGDNGFQSVRVQRNQRGLWPREISLASAIYKIRPHLWRRLFEIQNAKKKIQNTKY